MKSFYFVILFVFLFFKFTINCASDDLDKKLQVYFPLNPKYERSLSTLKILMSVSGDSITEEISSERSDKFKNIVKKDLELLENFLQERCLKISIRKLVAERYSFSKHVQLPRKIVFKEKNFEGCPKKRSYCLPSVHTLFSILRFGHYSLEELKTLEYKRLNSDQILFKLLEMQAKRKCYVWEKNQPTIFQLVDRVIKESRAWPYL